MLNSKLTSYQHLLQLNSPLVRKLEIFNHLEEKELYLRLDFVLLYTRKSGKESLLYRLAIVTGPTMLRGC